MTSLLEPLLILVLALNFCALGVSRIRSVINAVALQGILLGLLPLLVHPEIGWRVLLLAVATIAIKGFVIPPFLIHAMQEAEIQHEITPVISNMTSLLLGAVGTALAMLFEGALPLEAQHSHLRLIPTALATLWTGILMLTTRRKAIMLVLGYLLLENGIYLFGLLLLEAMPLLVEVGVLLDLFTAVFVMGIIIHHISREFASMGTQHLTELKE